MHFAVQRCQVNIVCVILQASCPLLSLIAFTPGQSLLVVGTVSCAVSTDDAEAIEIIAQRGCPAIAVRTYCFSTLIFAQVLNAKVQTVNQAEEAAVTVSRQTTITAGEEVIAFASVATELWQHIGDADCIINQAIVTAVVEGTCITEFQTCERQTGFVTCLSIGAFRVVTLEVVFPLTIAGQLVVDFGFAFEAQTSIGLVAIVAVIIREVMQTNCFPVQIQFIRVFVIDFCSVSCTGYQQGRDYHCQNIALHHYLLPSLVFL